VGIFAAADRPGARRPAGKVEGVQLGDLGARTWLAAGVDRGLPGVGRHGQDRGADALVGGQADREPHAALAQVVDQGMGGAAGVGADQQRLVTGGLGELGERQVDYLDVVGGAVGAGVARPQDPSQGLAGAIVAVQEGDQPVEAEAALVGPSRALLVGVGVQQRAVHIHHHQALDVRAHPPGRRSGVGTGRAQAGKPVWIASDLLNHPPRRWR
jgi:hypothetical protein